MADNPFSKYSAPDSEGAQNSFASFANPSSGSGSNPFSKFANPVNGQPPAAVQHLYQDPNQPWYKRAWDWGNTPITESLFGMPEERQGAGGFERAVEHIASGLTSPLSLALTAATFGTGGAVESVGASALREAGLGADEIANAVKGAEVASTAAKSLPSVEPVIQKALEEGGHDLGLLQRAKEATGPVDMSEKFGSDMFQKSVTNAEGETQPGLLEKAGFNPEEREALGKASETINQAKAGFTPVDDALKEAGVDVDKWKQAQDTLYKHGLSEKDLLGGNMLERGAYKILRTVAPDISVAATARAAKTANTILNAGFTYQQLESAAAMSPRFLDALKEGDYDHAMEYGTEALVGGGLGIAGASHALSAWGDLTEPLFSTRLAPGDVALAVKRDMGEQEALHDVANTQASGLYKETNRLLGHEPANPITGDKPEVRQQKALEHASVFHQVVTGGDKDKAAAWHNALSEAAGKDDRLPTSPSLLASGGTVSLPKDFKYEYHPVDTSKPVSGTFYHGTKAPISSATEFDPGTFGSERSLYGLGQYLTDNPEVAMGYAKTKGPKGVTGRVISANLDKANLLNLEEPLNPDALFLLRAYAARITGDPDFVRDSFKDGITGKDAIQHLRQSMSEENYTSGDALEVFQDMTTDLRQRGYDGLWHKGGEKVNGQQGPHNVAIIFPDFGVGKPISDIVRDAPASEFSPVNGLPPDLDRLIESNNFKNAKPEYQNLVLDSLKRVAEGKLSDKELAAAKYVSDQQSRNFEIGANNGLLTHQIQDYMRRVYKDENPDGKVVLSHAKSGNFATRVSMARQRVYDSHLTALLKSPKEIDFNVADNIAQGRSELIKAAANKQFMDRLLSKGRRWSDGRPLAVLSGRGNVTAGPNGEDPMTFISPDRVRKINISDEAIKAMNQGSDVSPSLPSRKGAGAQEPAPRAPKTYEQLQDEIDQREQVLDKDRGAGIKYYFPENESLLHLNEYQGPDHTPESLSKVVSRLNSSSLEYQVRDILKSMREGKSFKEAMSYEGSPALAKALGGDLVETNKISPEYKPMPKDLLELYKQRDAIGSQQLQQSIDDITNRLKSAGITNESEIKRILDLYSLDPKRTDAIKQYMASEYTQEATQKSPKDQLDRIYSALGAQRDLPIDDATDFYRDRQTTEDAKKALKAVLSYFYRGAEEERKGLPSGKDNVTDTPQNDLQSHPVNGQGGVVPGSQLERFLNDGTIKDLTPYVHPDNIRAAIARLEDQGERKEAQYDEVGNNKLRTDIMYLKSMLTNNDFSGLKDFNAQMKKVYAFDPHDYVTIDNAAMRGWNFVTNDPGGHRILVNTDIKVHPEFVDYLKNRLGLEKSGISQNPLGKAWLKTGTKLKETLLSLSPFHMVQEALRSVMIGMNPFSMETPNIENGTRVNPADPASPTKIKLGVQQGLTTGTDYKAVQDFTEGLSSEGGFLHKAPLVGKPIANTLHWYNDFLFRRYLPSLKTRGYELLFDRYKEAHPEWSDDRVAKVAAERSNATFGGINFRAMGRSQTMQDAFRAVALAPDWLESELRSAARLFNREEGGVDRMQVGKMALGLWGVARVLNLMTTGNPHLESPFGLSVKNKDGKEINFSIRTLPTDILHMTSDPVGFLKGRLSPGVHISQELLSQRDNYGRKLSPQELWVDVFRNQVPIPLQSIGQAVSGTGPEIGNPGQVWKSVGGTAQTYRTPAQKMAADLAASHSEDGLIDPEQMSRHRAVMDMEDRVRRGEVPWSEVVKLAYNTGQLHESELKKMQQNLSKTKGMDSSMASLYTRASRLPAKEYMDLYDQMNPAEKSAMVHLTQQVMRKYMSRAMKDMTPAERSQDPLLQRILGMRGAPLS